MFGLIPCHSSHIDHYQVVLPGKGIVPIPAGVNIYVVNDGDDAEWDTYGMVVILASPTLTG